MFGKMNFKAVISVLVGLISFAAGQATPEPLHPDSITWIQQIGDLVPHFGTKGTLYYTKYEQSDRIKSVSYQYDEASNLLINPSDKKTLCSSSDGINGSSGIVLHPDGDLLVAGQGERIYKVNPTAKDKGGNCLVKKATPATQKGGFWPLMMDPNGENLWGAGIPGYLYRFSTKTDPSNNNLASNGYQVELKPKGPNHSSDKKLTTVIWDDEGTAFFTFSDYFGGGCEAGGGTRGCTDEEREKKNNLKDSYFGVFTDTTWTTVTSSNQSTYGGKVGDKVITAVGTKVLIDSLEGAHGGAYDSYSKTIFVFGGSKIVQIQPYHENDTVKAKVIAEIDLRKYFFEESKENLSGPRTSGVGWRLHQGVADGLGHLFVSSNSGHIIFVDYSSNPKKIINDNLLIHVQWIDNYLDGLTLSNDQLAETYEVPENTSPGERFGEFYIYDENAADENSFSSFIVDKDECTSGTNCAQDLFDVESVDETDGESHSRKFVFITKKNLDYEALYNSNKGGATFNVTLTVRDADGTEMERDSRINVIDLNEEPSFNEESYSFNIEENKVLTSSFGEINASDPDIYNSSYGTLVYSLEGEDAALFDITSNGELVVASDVTFDYEKKSTYSFKAVVSDGINTTKVPVTVNILDVNEPLVFLTANSIFHVEENVELGTDVGTVVAADDDCNNSLSKTCLIPTYSFAEDYCDDYKLFTIDENTGLIKVKDALDYEEKNEYNLRVNVTAANDPTISLSTDVVINVDDMNDEPYFKEKSYILSVYEIAGQTIWDTLAAIDPDENAKLTYSLEGEDAEFFTIKTNTGELVTKKGMIFDYETKNSYRFGVVVTDGEFTKKTSVTVNVIDVNEKPIFIEPTKPFTFNENEPIGYEVGVLIFDDLDTASKFRNNKFECYECKRFGFNLDENTGILKTTRKFDYETSQKNYVLSIAIKDGSGDEQLTANGTITVELLDIENPDSSMTISAVFFDWAGESFHDSIDVDFGNVYNGNKYTKVGSDSSCNYGIVTDMVRDTLVNGRPARVESMIYPWDKCAAGHEIDKWFVPQVLVKDASGKEYTNSVNRDIKFQLDEDGVWYVNYSNEFDDCNDPASPGFFPLDDFEYLDLAKTIKNPKFDWNVAGCKHNYSFAMAYSAKFKYEKGQFIHFLGDDDTWIYINNRLVMDLGGVHSMAEGTVNLDTLGLKEGREYPFHIFYAERSATGSNFIMRTSITFMNESSSSVYSSSSSETSSSSFKTVSSSNSQDVESSSSKISSSSSVSERSSSSGHSSSSSEAVSSSSSQNAMSSSSKTLSSSSASGKSSSSEYSSSSFDAVSSNSSHDVVSSSSKISSSSSASGKSSSSTASPDSNDNGNKPGFFVRMTGSFEFEIVLDDELPRLAKQYAVMDMKGQVLYTGELSNRDARVKVSTPGAYVIRVGLGYKKVNVK